MTMIDSAQYIFPSDSLFEKASVVAPGRDSHDPHIHLHVLTLQLREPTVRTSEIYDLIRKLLGNEADDITTTPKALPSSGNPRERKYDKVTIEGSQKILSNLLIRLGAQRGHLAAVDDLGERSGAALGKDD